TAMPRRAHCHAASDPASPAPIIAIVPLTMPYPPFVAMLRASAERNATDQEKLLRVPCTCQSPSGSNRGLPIARRNNFPVAPRQRRARVKLFRYLCGGIVGAQTSLPETIP